MVKISGIQKKLNADTISTMLAELGISTENIAVVKNGIIVSRKDWNTEIVCDSDEIEFFSPVGGG